MPQADFREYIDELLAKGEASPIAEEPVGTTIQLAEEPPPLTTISTRPRITLTEAPVDSLRIDLRRKPSMEIDGKPASELTKTFGIEVDGKELHYPIPTIYGGEIVEDDEAVDRFVEAGFRDSETGRAIRGYETVEEADRAGRERSDALGRLGLSVDPVTGEEEGGGILGLAKSMWDDVTGIFSRMGTLFEVSARAAGPLGLGGETLGAPVVTSQDLQRVLSVSENYARVIEELTEEERKELAGASLDLVTLAIPVTRPIAALGRFAAPLFNPAIKAGIRNVAANPKNVLQTIKILQNTVPRETLKRVAPRIKRATELTKMAKYGSLVPPRESEDEINERLLVGAFSAGFGIGLPILARGLRRIPFMQGESFRQVRKKIEGSYKSVIPSMILKDILEALGPLGKQQKKAADDLKNLIDTHFKDDPVALQVMGRAPKDLTTGGTILPGTAQKAKRIDLTRKFKQEQGDLATDYTNTGALTPDDLAVNPDIVSRLREDMLHTSMGARTFMMEVIREGKLSPDLTRLIIDQIKTVKKAEKLFFKAREISGRTLLEFRNSMDALSNFGFSVSNLGEIKAKEGIITEFWSTLKRGWAGTESAGTVLSGLGEFGIGFWRRGIFPLWSFMRDGMTNAGAFASEAAQDVSEDIFELIAHKGTPFERSAGLIRSITPRGLGFRDEGVRQARNKIRKLAGESALSERYRPFFAESEPLWEIFKSKVTPGPSLKLTKGKLAERVVFAPLHLKKAVDTAFRRVGAMQSLYRDGYVEAAKKGLRGFDREKFIQMYVLDAPEKSIQRAFDKANRVGFTRQLGGASETLSNSKAVQFLITPYPRWNFQFTRFLATHSPLDPDFWGKMRAGKVTGGDITRFVTRNLEGLGAISFVDEAIYDHVDFGSLSFIHEDNSSVSLMGLSPIPEILAVNALLRGDSDNFIAASKYSSWIHAPIWAMKETTRTGGVGGLLLDEMFNIVNKGFVVDGYSEENLSRWTRAWMGARGTLLALEQLIDPTMRRGGFPEGLFADLPFVSQLAPETVDPVTGEAKQRQRIEGFSIPGILRVNVPEGININNPNLPFALELKDKVEIEMRRLGMNTWRIPKADIRGFEAKDLPPALRDEYEAIAGKRFYANATLVVNSDGWEKLEDGLKLDKLRALRTTARRYARNVLDRGHQSEVRQRKALKKRTDQKFEGSAEGFIDNLIKTFFQRTE